jgi:hypothetical protein
MQLVNKWYTFQCEMLGSLFSFEYIQRNRFVGHRGHELLNRFGTDERSRDCRALRNSKPPSILASLAQAGAKQQSKWR